MESRAIRQPNKDDERERILFYNLINSTFQTSQKVDVDTYCNSFTVVNIGATNMIVNGVPLLPPAVVGGIGESVSFGGNRGEIFIGRIDISFPTGIGNCVVTQKVYEPTFSKFLKL